ncbi:MAG TPA: putative Ig domain-containing protein [Candidatus Paceibacterota bacterium]|nr:putative Ig domain-containing protein [Candidatus Paceibacterota bacterium]
MTMNSVLRKAGLGIVAVAMIAALLLGGTFSSATAATIFSDGFGSGSSTDNISGWDEEGDDDDSSTRAQNPSGSGEDTASPNGGRFAKIADGEWICENISAAGYTSLSLSYYWRGDADAENNENAYVEVRNGSSCTASGWTQLASHELDDGNNNVHEGWSSLQTVSIPGGINSNNFSIRFRSASDDGFDENEFFRVDGVSVDGSLPDTTAPTVTINQAAGQDDPTLDPTIEFTVVFSESVTGFAAGDVMLGGTAGANTALVSGSGTTYTVTVTGMTGPGTVTASIGANKAQDGAGNGNTASTATDNTVTFLFPVTTATLDVVVPGSPTGAGANVSINGGAAGDYSGQVTLNDGDTFAVTADAVSGYTSDLTGTCSGTADAGEAYTCTVSYDLIIVEGNNAPVLDFIADLFVIPGETASFDADATDADEDTLTFSLSGEPEGASIDSGTGLFSWLMDESDLGTHTFSVIVSDGEDTDSQDVTVTVDTETVDPVTPTCPEGYYIEQGMCVPESEGSPNPCPIGSYNSQTGLCEAEPVEPSCPEGMSLNSDTGLCEDTTPEAPTCPNEASPVDGMCPGEGEEPGTPAECPEGTSMNDEFMCVADDVPFDCPENYGYDEESGMCVADSTRPVCPDHYDLVMEGDAPMCVFVPFPPTECPDGMEVNDAGDLCVAETPEEEQGNRDGGGRNDPRDRADNDDDGGEVLGAETGPDACVPLLTSYLYQGSANNLPEQVKLLQEFLNGELSLSLEVNGIYDAATVEAVNVFQIKYWEEVLAPWVPFGLATDHTPTGTVYKLTQWKINSLHCAPAVLPVPALP